MVFSVIIAALTAYLLGNLNGSVCISALVADDDVRRHGSGNAGLTNFFRNYGGWSTLLVLLGDVVKSALACYSAGLILKPYDLYEEGLALGAVAVTLGHDFPALLGFRGGKGILCGVTIATVLDWRLGLTAFLTFAIAYGLTCYVSLGSVLGAVSLLIGFAVLKHGNPWVMWAGIFLSVLAIFMHRANISRLLRGTESKVFLFKKDKKA